MTQPLGPGADHPVDRALDAEPVASTTAARGSLVGRRLARLRRRVCTEPGWRTLAAVFTITLLAYAIAAVRMLPFVEPPTGDQPHYLLQTISLVEDGDLDLRNNYTTAASYGQFSAPGRRREGFRGIPVTYHLQAEGHIVVSPASSGADAPAESRDRWFPKHSPGLPVLLVPGWLVGQALAPWLNGLTTAGGGGWPGTVFQMSVIGALLAVQLFLLAWDVTGRRDVAACVWIALSFSVPILPLSLMVYPEIPAALALVYAFRHLMVRPLPSQGWRLALVGLAAAALPWLNPRMVLVAGLLGLLSLAAVRRSSRLQSQQEARTRRVVGQLAAQFALLLGPLATSLVLLGWYHAGIHRTAQGVASQFEGFFVPTVADGRVGADWLALVLAAAGLLVDRQYGLLVFAPVYALAAVGLVALWRSKASRWLVVGLGLIVLPYAFLTADFRVWWGGWSPPARYLAVVTPLFAAPLARSLLVLGSNRPYGALFVGLSAFGVVVMVGLLSQLGHGEIEQAILSNPARNPALYRWLLAEYGLDLLSVLPGLAPWFADRGATVPWLQLAGSLGVVSAVVACSISGVQKPLAQRRGGARREPQTGQVEAAGVTS